MKTYVKTCNEIPGLHYWADAPHPVDFLKYPHRHIFEITAYFEVDNLDREIEIFVRQNQIKKYVEEKYKRLDGLCHFDGKSCEMIAKEILNTFDAAACEVNEDGKGGALVVRE